MKTFVTDVTIALQYGHFGRGIAKMRLEQFSQAMACPQVWKENIPPVGATQITQMLSAGLLGFAGAGFCG